MNDQTKQKCIRTAAIAAVSLTCVTRSAQAYLGSFDTPDGYWYQINAWVDVTNYNAGQYGPNAGGGPGPTAIAPDSSLWKLQSGVGDFFPTAAARNAAFSSAPPYPSGPVSGTVSAYIIGNHPGGRTGNALAVRNATAPGTGTMSYDYKMDSYDYGGTNPSTITSGPVDLKFWFESNDADPITQPIQDKFVMSFKDSTGNVGFQWGYGRDNRVIWRTGSSGPWVISSQVTDNTQYDGLDVQLNLTTQTFGIRYFDTSLSTFVPIAPLGTPLGASMNDFTHLGWSMADNVTFGSNGFGGKNFFDDFSFTVPTPEPSGMAILFAAGAALMRRRRRD